MADRGGSVAATRLLNDESELVLADDEMSAPTHDQVAELAYSYWEARGYQGGSPWEDWFRAETELKQRREI